MTYHLPEVRVVRISQCGDVLSLCYHQAQLVVINSDVLVYVVIALHSLEESIKKSLGYSKFGFHVYLGSALILLAEVRETLLRAPWYSLSL